MKGRSFPKEYAAQQTPVGRAIARHLHTLGDSRERANPTPHPGDLSPSSLDRIQKAGFCAVASSRSLAPSFVALAGRRRYSIRPSKLRASAPLRATPRPVGGVSTVSRSPILRRLRTFAMVAKRNEELREGTNVLLGPSRSVLRTERVEQNQPFAKISVEADLKETARCAPRGRSDLRCAAHLGTF